MRRVIAIFVGLWMGLSCLAGCAQLNVNTVRTVSVPITSGQTVLLILDNPTVSRTGSERAANDLLWGVGRKLIRAGVQVQAARSLPTEYGQNVIVILQVEDFRHVTPSDRLWKGAFAGRAGITVRVLVYERGQVESAGEVRVESRTGTHGFAGVDDEAVEAAVDRISAFLLRGY